MAAIDKIYLNSWKEFREFYDWCEQQPPLFDKYNEKVKLTEYIISHWTEEDFDKCRPIFSAPYYVDAYLIQNCPFDYIQKELMFNYGHWSQERIKEYYEDIKNWDSEKNGICPYWAELNDFIFNDDGTMSIKGLEESSYSKIKKGYLSPLANITYTVGKHFKCIKHPLFMFNTPFKSKYYWVQIFLPEEINDFMWYHKKHNSWDFTKDFVVSDSSNTAYVKTIRALKRLIIKWKLPIGTIVHATGRYIFDEYKFIVKK